SRAVSLPSNANTVALNASTLGCSFSDNSGTVSFTSFSPSSSGVNGSLAVTVVARDGSGNQSTRSMTAIVSDVTQPALGCSASFTKQVALGAGNTSISFGELGCSSSDISGIQSNTLSATTLAIGTHTVTVTARDNNG